MQDKSPRPGTPPVADRPSEELRVTQPGGRGEHEVVSLAVGSRQRSDGQALAALATARGQDGPAGAEVRGRPIETSFIEIMTLAQQMESDPEMADPALMGIVRRDGRGLFGDNCAVCHGTDARGGPGFPNLTSGTWLWGGDPETIAETA